MNRRQIMQLILAGCGVVLLVFWLFTAEGGVGRILGLLSNALLILAMLLSYRAEEKLKKKDEGK